MSGLDLKLNRAGVGAVLKDENVARRLLEIGQQVAQNASGHQGRAHPNRAPTSYTAEIHRGVARVSVHVYPTDAEALFGEPYHHWLISALDEAHL